MEGVSSSATTVAYEMEEPRGLVISCCGPWSEPGGEQPRDVDLTHPGFRPVTDPCRRSASPVPHSVFRERR